MPTRTRIMVALVVVLALSPIVVSGCGSRGPLDDTPVIVLEAGTSEGSVPNEASTEAGPPSIFGDAGPIACAACVATQCNQPIFACLQARGCVGVFQCALTKCLSGGGGGGGGGLGGLDSGCLLGCATSDPSGIVPILSIVTCLTTQCNGQCGDIIGGALGGIPGLGGGSSSSGGRSEDDARMDAMREVFAPWPPMVPQR